MKVKTGKSTLKPETKLSSEFLSLRELDSNYIISSLEENMKLREMPVEKRLKRNLNQKV